MTADYYRQLKKKFNRICTRYNFIVPNFQSYSHFACRDMSANCMTANCKTANCMTANCMTANFMTANCMTTNLMSANCMTANIMTAKIMASQLSIIQINSPKSNVCSQEGVADVLYKCSIIAIIVFASVSNHPLLTRRKREHKYSL